MRASSRLLSPRAWTDPRRGRSARRPSRTRRRTTSCLPPSTPGPSPRTRSPPARVRRCRCAAPRRSGSCSTSAPRTPARPTTRWPPSPRPVPAPTRLRCGSWPTRRTPGCRHSCHRAPSACPPARSRSSRWRRSSAAPSRRRRRAAGCSSSTRRTGSPTPTAGTPGRVCCSPASTARSGWSRPPRRCRCSSRWSPTSPTSRSSATGGCPGSTSCRPRCGPRACGRGRWSSPSPARPSTPPRRCWRRSGRGAPASSTVPSRRPPGAR